MSSRARMRTAAAEWDRADAEWRDPAQVVTQWANANTIDPKLLKFTARGDWWRILEGAAVTLLVTREYEHLTMAISADDSGPSITFLPLPHPSGVAVDDKGGVVHVASTRNPNQIVDLVPAKGAGHQRTLVPVRSRFLPGRLYLHDLAVMGQQLFATAVGENAIVKIHDDGQVKRVWWPKAIERRTGPRFEQNYLQLNSIAAGTTLENSFFTASTDRVSALRPGHQDFRVDKRGVIFSGKTRAPLVTGLTRPHSARLFKKQLWVDNSGYGEFCVVDGQELKTVARLPGWTRGLGFHKSTAFVGTSRVIPRFRQYAPGLEMRKTECGVHAVDIRSGEILGSLIWPMGNQIFAVEAAPRDFCTGLPFSLDRKRSLEEEKKLFYAFELAE